MQYDPAAHDPTLCGQAQYGQTPYAQASNVQAPNGRRPYGEAAYGETPYAAWPHTQAPYGQTPDAQTPYTQTPCAEMPYGQAPYGLTPYGQTPYAPEPNALAPYGQSPYEQPPYGERPYGQQNEGYDCVPVVEDDKTEMSGRSTWMTIAMCCTAALIVLGILLGMLAFTCSTKQTPGTTESQEFTEFSVPPSRVTLAPPTRSPSPATTTEYTPAKVGRQPLLCNMGSHLTSARQFPPDGLCEYIFFDSLYEQRFTNRPLNETYYREGLKIFLRHDPDYRNTTLGVGFSFE
ncbi:hypothetical protein MTO96_017627 [Rhipicephalus appendiculatus]